MIYANMLLRYGHYYNRRDYTFSELLILLLMMILPLIASAAVNSTFKKYSKVSNSRGLTAEQAARMILDSNGLNYIRIETIKGNLTDHFSPAENVVRLSESVYGKTSVAAIGVAAHECGHACQHAEEYAPIKLRTAIVPAVNICGKLWYFVFLIGVLFFEAFPIVTYIGIAMFGAVVLFQLITLPTELDASHRALQTLESYGILDINEITPAKKVLTAAAMTYVTSLLVSIMQFIRLVARTRR